MLWKHAILSLLLHLFKKHSGWVTHRHQTSLHGLIWQDVNLRSPRMSQVWMSSLTTVCYTEITDLRMPWLTNQGSVFNKAMKYAWLVMDSNLSIQHKTHYALYLEQQTQLWCFASSHISKTGRIFCIPSINSQPFPRLLRCCMWLCLKERGISTPPAPQTVWQPSSCSWSQGCELNQLHVYRCGTKHSMALSACLCALEVQWYG